ncbi:hypothetical protein HZB60_05515 [candidate division KSB1 bacterium]|nr:hypothetical protein [candidate division KSB1 bacterium]
MKAVYLMGIGGIAMSNIAVLLKQAGYDVSGSDEGVYEPAATILRNSGVRVHTPYAATNLPADGTPVIVGNAQSRGHVEVEAALDRGLPLFSFPEFLCRHILPSRHTMVVAGTHGKSTTSAALTHLLAATGRQPGYLIGAQPLDLPFGADLGAGPPFVIEGDEYDSAFFDKRSKFLHYFPRTLILGSVEFDHADIFANLDEVLLAFRRLLRTLPSNGALIYDHDALHSRELAAHAPCRAMAVGRGEECDWRLLDNSTDFEFRAPDRRIYRCAFIPVGAHNRRNMLMALAAACVERGNPEAYLGAIASFHGIRRRLERLYQTADLIVYDDFAHHPTAIHATLSALRERYPGHRLIAAIEPRSNTMVRNIFQHELPRALAVADEIVIGDIHRLERIPVAERLDYDAISLELDRVGVAVSHARNRELADDLLSRLNGRPAVIVFMSNGGFSGIPHSFVARLP